MIGRSILEFIIEDDVALVLESLEYLLERSGMFRPMEFRYRRPNGSTGVLEAVSANRLRDPAVEGIVVQVHDVTERRIIDQVLEAIASGATFAATMRLVARLVEEQLEGTRAIIGVDPLDGRFRTAVSAFDLVDDLAGNDIVEPPVEDEATRTGRAAIPSRPTRRHARRARGAVGPGDPDPRHGDPHRAGPSFRRRCARRPRRRGSRAAG